MSFFKKLFEQEDLIIGLCSLKKKKEYIKINIPQEIKNTFIIDTKSNILLY